MGDALRVVVMADTHLRHKPGDQPPRHDLPAQAWDLIAGSDAILHAGDVLDAGTLARLGAAAPIFAVLGNNDVSLVGSLPETRVLQLAGVCVAMIHDSGPRSGRPNRMYRRFQDAAIVVFGHSHIPCDEVGLEGQILFNPGSATTRRSQPVRTIGELVLADGRVEQRRIVDLGP